MRLWTIVPAEPLTDDRAYLLGFLKGVFDDIDVSVVDRAAARAPQPERRPDLILNLLGGRNRRLLEQLESLAAGLGASISPSADAAARADDKRTYIRDFADVSPETRIARSIDDVRVALADFGEIVIKDPFGMRGSGVERLRSEADLPLASELLQNNVNGVGEVVVQPFMSGFARGDKRIIVQRSPEGPFEIVGQIGRKPAAGAWKTGLRAGGHSYRTELSAEERRLALEVASRSGLDNATIDIGEHDGRLFYIEHNQAYGGIIDFDLQRGAQSVRACCDFLVHLARFGRR